MGKFSIVRGIINLIGASWRFYGLTVDLRKTADFWQERLPKTTFYPFFARMRILELGVRSRIPGNDRLIGHCPESHFQRSQALVVDPNRRIVEHILVLRHRKITVYAHCATQDVHQLVKAFLLVVKLLMPSFTRQNAKSSRASTLFSYSSSSSELAFWGSAGLETSSSCVFEPRITFRAILSMLWLPFSISTCSAMTRRLV